MYILVNKIKNNSIQSESETELYFEFIKSSLVLPVPLLFKLERSSTDSALFQHVNLWYSHKQFYLDIRTTRIYNQMAEGLGQSEHDEEQRCKQSRAFSSNQNHSICLVASWSIKFFKTFHLFQIFNQNRIWFQGQPRKISANDQNLTNIRRKFTVNWSPAGLDQYQRIVSHCAKVVLDSVK